MAAFPGGATKSFGNDLSKMCGAPPFLMRQQIAHVVVRLAKSAAQATSPGANAAARERQRRVLLVRRC